MEEGSSFGRGFEGFLSCTFSELCLAGFPPPGGLFVEHPHRRPAPAAAHLAPLPLRLGVPPPALGPRLSLCWGKGGPASFSWRKTVCSCAYKSPFPSLRGHGLSPARACPQRTGRARAGAARGRRGPAAALRGTRRAGALRASMAANGRAGRVRSAARGSGASPPACLCPSHPHEAASSHMDWPAARQQPGRSAVLLSEG